jgi:hypothetical protein
MVPLRNAGLGKDKFETLFTSDPETNENEFLFSPDPPKERHGVFGVPAAFSRTDRRHKSSVSFPLGFLAFAEKKSPFSKVAVLISSESAVISEIRTTFLKCLPMRD